MITTHHDLNNIPQEYTEKAKCGFWVAEAIGQPPTPKNSENKIEIIRQKAAGILDKASENLNNKGNVVKTEEISKIIEDQIVDSNNFDLEIEALFEKNSD